MRPIPRILINDEPMRKRRKLLSIDDQAYFDDSNPDSTRDKFEDDDERILEDDLRKESAVNFFS